MQATQLLHDLGQSLWLDKALRNRLGIAMAQRTYQAYHALLSSAPLAACVQAGARPQRLLWASTSTRDS
jgi:transaldolase